MDSYQANAQDVMGDLGENSTSVQSSNSSNNNYQANANDVLGDLGESIKSSDSTLPSYEGIPIAVTQGAISGLGNLGQAVATPIALLSNKLFGTNIRVINPYDVTQYTEGIPQNIKNTISESQKNYPKISGLSNFATSALSFPVSGGISALPKLGIGGEATVLPTALEKLGLSTNYSPIVANILKGTAQGAGIGALYGGSGAQSVSDYVPKAILGGLIGGPLGALSSSAISAIDVALRAKQVQPMLQNQADNAMKVFLQGRPNITKLESDANQNFTDVDKLLVNPDGSKFTFGTKGNYIQGFDNSKSLNDFRNALNSANEEISQNPTGLPSDTVAQNAINNSLNKLDSIKDIGDVHQQVRYLRQMSDKLIKDDPNLSNAGGITLRNLANTLQNNALDVLRNNGQDEAADAYQNARDFYRKNVVGYKTLSNAEIQGLGGKNQIDPMRLAKLLANEYDPNKSETAQFSNVINPEGVSQIRNLGSNLEDYKNSGFRNAAQNPVDMSTLLTAPAITGAAAYMGHALGGMFPEILGALTAEHAIGKSAYPAIQKLVSSGLVNKIPSNYTNMALSRINPVGNRYIGPLANRLNQ